jgi:hypothetical protein
LRTAATTKPSRSARSAEFSLPLRNTECMLLQSRLLLPDEIPKNVFPTPTWASLRSAFRPKSSLHSAIDFTRKARVATLVTGVAHLTFASNMALVRARAVSSKTGPDISRPGRLRDYAITSHWPGSSRGKRRSWCRRRAGWVRRNRCPS